MKKAGTKKPASKKVAATPKSVPPKKEKESALPLGKHSHQTRATFILGLLIQNRKDKAPDSALLAKAKKEFSDELVPGPSGTFTIAHQRGVANKDRVLGRRGLKKADAEFLKYDGKEA